MSGASDIEGAVGVPARVEANGASMRTLAEARARVAALESELAEQARLRAELVHLVSHELRTPITVISGFARLLQNETHGPLNETQRRFVREGLRACGRLDDLVSDLLEARPDARTPFRVDPAPASLHETIESQLEALMPMLEERGLRVEMELRADDAAIDFDPRRIAQVVTNLMTNAIRYGRPQGTIRVETRDRVEGAVTLVEVVVEDDGAGIAEADRERLFLPYVRGAVPSDDAGLGIGLALCRRIVEAHGGRIRVEAGALGGARFVFAWPRAAASKGKDVGDVG